jgi:hypothetical protein
MTNRDLVSVVGLEQLVAPGVAEPIEHQLAACGDCQKAGLHGATNSGDLVTAEDGTAPTAPIHRCLRGERDNGRRDLLGQPVDIALVSRGQRSRELFRCSSVTEHLVRAQRSGQQVGGHWSTSVCFEQLWTFDDVSECGAASQYPSDTSTARRHLIQAGVESTS